MDGRSRLLLLLAISFGSATEMSAVEKGIGYSDLLAEVKKGVEIEERTAKVLDFSRKLEGNEIVYEAELIENGRRRHILLDVNGAVLEVKDELLCIP